MPPSSLKCFGVGDGWPSPDRDHSAYLYRFGANSILIDCGEPISRSYKASGLNYDLIDSLFLSHLHFDHVGGIFMLVQGFWLEGRKKELPVHLSEHGIVPLQQMLRAGYIFDDLLPFRLRFEALQGGQIVTVGAVKVQAFPTSHLALLQEMFSTKYAQSYTAFSFLIEAGDLRVGHSADVGAVEDLAPLLEKPLDLLVCELAHVHPKKLFQFLRGRDIRQILLVHLGREWRTRLDEIRALAKSILGPVPVWFPQDGDEFLLGS